MQYVYPLPKYDCKKLPVQLVRSSSISLLAIHGGNLVLEISIPLKIASHVVRKIFNGARQRWK